MFPLIQRQTVRYDIGRIKPAGPDLFIQLGNQMNHRRLSGSNVDIPFEQIAERKQVVFQAVYARHLNGPPFADHLGCQIECAERTALKSPLITLQ